MILFVASNPSHLNYDPLIPFAGSRSEKNFKEWAEFLAPEGYKVINAADQVTYNNRRIAKSEINIVDFKTKILNNKPTKIIALGTTASMALEMAGEVFFKLPHPSPLNRFLNNKVYLDAVLQECKEWLSITIH